MKKNTLGILLVSPIVISLLTFATTTVLINSMMVDLQDIAWNYKENVGFKIDEDEGVLLEAEGVYDKSSTLSEGNNLVWTVSNIVPKEDSEAEVCSIEEEDGYYYLFALSAGEATITCQNEKRTVSRSFRAIIYENAAITINPGAGVAPLPSTRETRYYGQYDLRYEDSLAMNAYEKVAASLLIDVSFYTDEGYSSSYSVSSISDNISYDEGLISFLGSGEAHITFSADESSYGDISSTYSFFIVEDGVNIYSYDDLLRATNFSRNGEIAVMQISLGSLIETYRYTKNDDGVKEYRDEYLNESTRLFGHYDFSSGSFSFASELYEFESDYPTDYIDQYNEAKGTNISTRLKAALHVQKSIYGNGFSLNMHNIAYPNNGAKDSISGKLVPDKDKDYFQGPLPYVFVGDPTNDYVAVEAFGQDNAGLYIDEDDVIIDDLRVRNADEQKNRFDYTYTGSVIDIENASNVTLRNSIISDGKNVVRAFSSDNLLIDNCILQDSGEFLLYLGSNNHNGVDRSKTVNYAAGGQEVDQSFNQYFDTSYKEGSLSSPNADFVYDKLLWSKDLSSEEKAVLLEALEGTQNALDNTIGIVNDDGSVNYDAHVRVKDTDFSSSGVYSIALDSMFNGGYLYNGYPSSIWDTIDSYMEAIPALKQLIGPFIDSILAPQEIGGTSYPVELTLEGDTKFYDWKDISSIDTSALIDENLLALVRQMASSLGIEIGNFTLGIDEYFPIKAILEDEARENGMLYEVSDEEGNVTSYINTSLIWYGGGLNLSSYSNNITSTDNNFEGEVTLDMVNAYVNGTHIGENVPSEPSQIKTLVGMIATAVACVTGTHDFKAIGDTVNEGEVPALFGKFPTL